MSIDILYIILMVFAVFKGISRGLIIGVFSILGFIVGLAAALKLSAVVAQKLQSSTSMPGPWLPVISFILVFIVVVVLISILARVIDKTFDIAMLGWLDSLGGIVLYVIIYTVLFSVLLFYAANLGMVKQETIAASVTYPYIQPWGPVVMNNFGKIIPAFKDVFQQLENFFDHLADKAVTPAVTHLPKSVSFL
jgi:membrane protein required for colicin V production